MGMGIIKLFSFIDPHTPTKNGNKRQRKPLFKDKGVDSSKRYNNYKYMHPTSEHINTLSKY